MFSINVFDKTEENVGISNGVVRTNINEINSTYEIQRCLNWISENQFTRVCLQFPDKLLADSSNIALQLKGESGANVYILGDTSYGSCCIDEVAAEHVNADCIIHYGHACLGDVIRLPVLYVFEKAILKFDSLIEQWNNLFSNHNEKLILFYDVSFNHIVEDITKSLSGSYPELIISTLAINGLQSHFIGRCVNLKFNINEYTGIYIGEDNQTFFNVSITFNVKKWYIFNYNHMKESSPLDCRWLRRRMFLVEKCRDAKTIGLLVGTLTVKGYLEAIEHVQKLTAAWKKKTYIFSVGKPNPAKLANLPEIDMFVLIGCPENVLYNDRDFFKPIVTLFEVELSLNPVRETNKQSTQYCVEFSALLPGGKLYSDFLPTAIKLHDMSLISGQIRDIQCDNRDDSVAEDNQYINVRSGRELASLGGGLESRTWKGLKQNLGEDEPKLAVPGRTGIAASYQQEQRQ